MFKGIPIVLGSDMPETDGLSRNTALAVGGGVIVGSLLLNLGIAALVGYGIYRLFKD